MIKKILNVCAISILLATYVNAADDVKDVNTFVQLLSKTSTPTLADFYYYYGQGSELELEFMLNHCEKKGWKPAPDHPKCSKYINDRENNKLVEPSLFFKWLKTKLPMSAQLKIIRVEHIRGKDLVEYDLVYAKLNDVEVTFYRPVGSEINIGQFGVLGLSKIKGVSVDNLLKKDLSSKR